MIYFDNSASTLIKPKQVQKAMLDALEFYSSNPGRSGHREAIKTALEVEKVREKLAKHLGADNVIFTGGCTHALNLAILGTAYDGEVVCTENEHNSVLRPLQHLADEKNVRFKIATQAQRGRLTFLDLESHLTKDTKLVIVNHISNSMLALAPHKGFYSPQGVGCLAICGDIKLSPILFGGTGTNSLELHQPDSLPERLESGTICTPNILAFGAGVNFVEENFYAIREKLDDLTTFLHYELSKLPVKIYTSTENTNGVLAFNIDGIHSTDLANILSEKYGICVRGGYHCAPKKHEALGTIDTGLVRVSFSLFNTLQEVEKLIFAIKQILKTKPLANC